MARESAAARARAEDALAVRTLIAAAVATFALDQLSKWLVVHRMGLRERGAIDLLPPWVNLRMAWNEGVNFGLGAGLDMRWVLVVVALAISTLVVIWVRRDRAGRWAHAAAGLLVGGALGNVVDRVLYGAVADFLNLSCCGLDNPYAFNVADIAVFAGAVGLVMLSGGRGPGARPERRRPRKTQGTAPERAAERAPERVPERRGDAARRTR